MQCRCTTPLHWTCVYCHLFKETVSIRKCLLLSLCEQATSGYFIGSFLALGRTHCCHHRQEKVQVIWHRGVWKVTWDKFVINNSFDWFSKSVGVFFKYATLENWISLRLLSVRNCTNVSSVLSLFSRCVEYLDLWIFQLIFFK